MPYPTKPPICKHDIVSPNSISISSGKLEPLFDSKQAILHQVQHIQIEMKKAALSPIYTYDDAPTQPRQLSRALFIGGFCNLSNIIPTSSTIFNYESFTPYPEMTLCHIAVKRADGEQALDPKLLENSKKFKFLCENLRLDSKLALIICPKTDRVGFLIPMNKYEDGSDYAAYYYVGERSVVKQMLSTLIDKNNDNENGGYPDDIFAASDENDEVIWKPDDDNGYDNKLWKPPSDNQNNSEDLMWHPSTSNNNEESASFTHTSIMDRVDFGELNNNANTSKNNETFHTDSGAAAADKFYSELTRSLETRSESILYHMRNFNGWVKATQIAELDPKTIVSSNSNNASKKRKRTRHPLRVLDLACGKGGDLGKWVLHNRGVQLYVGSDVARGSLVDAAIRARNMSKQLKNKCTFICADLGADVPGRFKNKQSDDNKGKMQKLLSWSLESDDGIGDPVFRHVRGGGVKATDKFDVVSIQFAIHYMMSSEKRARRFFQTVSELLDVGGNLIATTIDARVVIDHLMDTGYNFHFDDNGSKYTGSNDNEFVTIKVGKDACQLKFHRDVVKRLFQPSQSSSSSNSDGTKINPDLFGLEYTFTLVEGENHAAGVGQAVDLPEWLTPLPVLKQLAEEAGLVMEYASNFHDFFEERKDPLVYHSVHNALYNMNVLNWNGSISEQEWDISRMYVAIKFRKESESSMILDLDDEVDPDDDDEDDDQVDDEEEQQHQVEDTEPNVPPNDIQIDMSDPKVMKLYTKAMAQAKMSYTGEWKSLSSDERKTLINVELSKMV